MGEGEDCRQRAGAAKPAAGTWAAKHDAELKANGWKVMGGRGPSKGETTWYEKDGHEVLVKPDGTWEHFLPGGKDKSRGPR